MSHTQVGKQLLGLTLGISLIMKLGPGVLCGSNFCIELHFDPLSFCVLHESSVTYQGQGQVILRSR